MIRRVLPICVVMLTLAVTARATPVNIFNDTFNGGVVAGGTAAGGITATFSGVTNTENVQGYDFSNTGLGFTGQMLRNASSGNPAAISRLTLTGLGAHNVVNLDFLLAIIDSWDGSGGFCCGPDRFNVTVGDGFTQTTVFSEVFDNFDDGYAVGATQTFHVPIERHGQFGFNTANDPNPATNGTGGFTDSAYQLDGLMWGIAHTSSTLVIDFYASGPGWQGGADESWGIDELKVSMDTVPEPGSILLLGTGLATLARRRLRAKR
jgi:hypothetical protein